MPHKPVCGSLTSLVHCVVDEWAWWLMSHKPVCVADEWAWWLICHTSLCESGPH